MRYILVSGLNHLDFVSEVNKYINKGWIPQGGFFMFKNDITKYYQAMIKIDS